jgi:predicted nucleotidyltransferase
MHSNLVLGIAEMRSSLPQLIRELASGGLDAILVGSHRKPQAMLVGYSAEPSDPLKQLQSKARIISTLARGCGLSTVSVSGSVARGEASQDSDIDLVCEGQPGTTLFDVAAFETVMEDLMGRPVTAMLRSSLDEKLDNQILSDAIVIAP